jgi:hypothetical protein
MSDANGTIPGPTVPLNLTADNLSGVLGKYHARKLGCTNDRY